MHVVIKNRSFGFVVRKADRRPNLSVLDNHPFDKEFSFYCKNGLLQINLYYMSFALWFSWVGGILGMIEVG